jgi:mannosyltransferase
LPLPRDPVNDLQAIVPNLHWRYSGVTATNRMVAPKVAALLPVAWLGPDAPNGMPRLKLSGLLKLWHRKAPIVWHARRNDEMIVGVLLKWLGWPLKLVFTSAAQRWHTALTRALMRRMDAITATSAAAASYLQREAIVIHHGVDTERYAPPADRAAAFAEAKLPGRFAIGCFGRVRAQKGTDLFVEAMCRLLPEYPDHTAVVVGAITVDQQPFANRLKQRIREAGLEPRIVMLGELPVDDVPAWFRRLSIYAFTSRNDGFGLTLIEAMACGLPMVAARAGAAEIVVADGETGFLVPTGDSEALADAIERLMRDPAMAAAMGERARQRVLSEFSLDAEAQAFAKVYRTVLEG